MEKLSSHYLIIPQVFCTIGCCFPFGLKNQGSYRFLLLCSLGFLLDLYTFMHNRPGNYSIYPEMKSRSKLITTGPYRYIRHPMYLALLFMMTGVACFHGYVINYLSLGFLVFVLLVKIHREERILSEVFPEYVNYSKIKKRLIPYIW